MSQSPRLWGCMQDVARAGELQAATRQALEQGTRTLKEKLHTKGRHRKQCQLHLRVRGVAGSRVRLPKRTSAGPTAKWVAARRGPLCCVLSLVEEQERNWGISLQCHVGTCRCTSSDVACVTC